MAISVRINGKVRTVQAPLETKLLWVIREELKLTGTKFGCGAGQCGACMVHLDGERMFSCLLPLSELKGRSVTTIEGLPEIQARPLQDAWVAEQVPQCGYCQSGQIMSAAVLLRKTPHPTRTQIVEHMSANICRCGTYPKIVKAIERATGKSSS